eukprot:scaffold1948_cov417-Pavlova_lutheri.AAC.2
MARAESRPLDPSHHRRRRRRASNPATSFRTWRFWGTQLLDVVDSVKRWGTDAFRPRRRAQTRSAHRVSTRVPPPAPHTLSHIELGSRPSIHPF